MAAAIRRPRKDDDDAPVTDDAPEPRRDRDDDAPSATIRLIDRELHVHVPGHDTNPARPLENIDYESVLVLQNACRAEIGCR
jgi:hypothetical protein